MRIAVDFDNVLYDYDGKWAGGSLQRLPVAGAVQAMQRLAGEGHTLIIFSTRGWLKAHRERMATWLTAAGIPFKEIARTKPNADLYIDDKALHFVDWESALEEIGRRVV